MTHRLHRFAALSIAALMLVQQFLSTAPAHAASGDVLLHLDGTSKTYTDRLGSKQLLGTAEYSGEGRGFNERRLISLSTRTPVPGARSSFPYGVLGMHEDDFNGDGDYNDTGDADPLDLMDAIQADGVYNIAVSGNLGHISNKAKIIRTLKGARDRNLKLVVRLLEWNRDFTINDTVVNGNIKRWQEIFAEHPDLKDVVYAWYSYDEPMNRDVSLSEQRQMYTHYKKAWPHMQVFAVFTQDPRRPDSNGDGISDGMLGQPENPYGTGVADIVGLNVYIATSPDDYNYGAISKLYVHARRTVSRVNPNNAIWAVAQAHAFASMPSNHPEPHQMYRQTNDWFQAGPRAGLPGIDGFFWYTWHFPNNTKQVKSDLEGNLQSRRISQAIGKRVASGAAVAHKLGYRSEIYLDSVPLSALKAPRVGHLNLARGSITFAISRRWAGGDGIRHVLFDTGASATRNRFIIEKTASNVLRLVMIDGNGASKWTGLNVNSTNMPGKWMPGYSEIAATWDDGVLALYLDGVRGGLRGGTGTGKLSSGGTYVHIGTDMTGRYSAYGTYRHLTIRSAAGTAGEIAAWAKYSYTDLAPTSVGLVSPVNSASTSDRTPTLSWYRTSTAVKYQVQVSTEPGFTAIVRSLTLTATAYTTPTNLSPGTYYWRVRALDNYGAGGWSTVRILKVQ